MPRYKTSLQRHQQDSCTLLKGCAWQLCRRVAMMAVVGILFTEAVGALLAPFLHTQVLLEDWHMVYAHVTYVTATSPPDGVLDQAGLTLETWCAGIGPWWTAPFRVSTCFCCSPVCQAQVQMEPLDASETGKRHTMLYTHHQLSHGVSTAFKPAWLGSI